MVDHRKAFQILMCPSCFAREIDLMLAWDSDEDVYYCQRCCYEGKAEEIKAFYRTFRDLKYKQYNQ